LNVPEDPPVPVQDSNDEYFECEQGQESAPAKQKEREQFNKSVPSNTTLMTRRKGVTPYTVRTL
jgi:hypothetical protein